MSGLTLEAVRIALGERRLLEISQRIAPGEILTVMGASGSGKSSLIAYIGGFLTPEFTASGCVALNGRRINALPAERRRVGVLFQEPTLFPHMSVLDNLTFGLPSGLARAERRERAEAALARAGLAGYGAADPATLSGGQAARVALMRTLLSEPEAILLDEPFSSLDADLRARMREIVFGDIRAAGLPALLATHDRDDSEAAGGSVVVL